MAKVRHQVENTNTKIYNDKGERICSVEGCGKKHHCKGYCAMHYKRLQTNNSLQTVLRTPTTHSLKDPIVKSTNTSYKSMLTRCKAKEGTPHYSKYMGRGISVCDKWEKGFDYFVEDMGMKPTLNHSIDRIDNEKGYCAENCRWATPQQQSYNTRKSSANKSGYTGVSWHIRQQAWSAYGNDINGKRVSLGYYQDVHEAGEIATKYRENIKKLVYGRNPE